MSWQPNEKEIRDVLMLDSAERYTHWIKKVADEQQVWSLWKEGGWAITCDDMDRQLVPVWPHLLYAGLCANEAWEGYQPRSISLEIWLSRWIAGIEKDKRLIAVFPTPNNKGIPVEPKRLEQDLRIELSNYE